MAISVKKSTLYGVLTKDFDDQLRIIVISADKAVACLPGRENAEANMEQLVTQNMRFIKLRNRCLNGDFNFNFGPGKGN